MVADKDAFLKIMRVSIDPEKCGDLELMVKFNFTDVNENYGFYINSCIGKIIENPKQADLELNISYDNFCNIATKEKNIRQCLDNGDLEVIGDMSKFEQFLNVFDL